MANPRDVLFLDVMLASMVTADLVWTLKTGRAHGRRGTITREHQPARFWRYVYSSYVMLALCTAVFVWAMIWPDSLR